VDTRRLGYYLDHVSDLGTTMADVRKIRVALTQDQIADLQAVVDSGAYGSTDEIVQEAITAWRFGHGLLDDDVARLRGLWDAGKASGATRPFDIERILAAARGRLGKAAAE
jgi:antitoxin ParD1/3/4